MAKATQIEPFEWRPLQCTIIEIEPIDVNVDLSHEFSPLEIRWSGTIDATQRESIILCVSPLPLSGQEAKPTFGVGFSVFNPSVCKLLSDS